MKKAKPAEDLTQVGSEAAAKRLLHACAFHARRTITLHPDAFRQKNLHTLLVTTNRLFFLCGKIARYVRSKTSFHCER